MRDPYLRTNTSFASKAGRAVWQIVWLTLFLPSPRPFHGWRALLLRLFGARLGKHCHIYPSARIWAPWHLVCGDFASVADRAEIYNPTTVVIDHHAILSQGAYLCGASHDLAHPEFPMIVEPIHLEPWAWICARAVVQMGVRVGEGSVLALGAIATKNLQPWTIYAGIPAKKIGVRKQAVLYKKAEISASPVESAL